MPNKVSIDGKQYTLKDSSIKGEGGEAIIYQIDNDHVVKIFKEPLPKFFHTESERKMAKAKIDEHQKKLPAFPKGMPSSVITPISPALYNKRIVGYKMAFQKGAEVLSSFANKRWVESSGIKTSDVIDIFVKLHRAVKGVHDLRVVIGDFNDQNVLVKSNTPFLIDADSFQFGQFACHTFTDKFVDPLNCDANGTTPELVRPHSPNSDWFAFNVMLIRSLLYLSPYGGVYKPKDKSKRILDSQRSLKRITAFDKEVKLPKVAKSFDILSDDLLEHFQKTFKEDRRIEFPISLLASPFRGDTTIITKNNTTEIVRENVIARRVFITSGIIIDARSSSTTVNFTYNKDSSWYVNSDSSSYIGGTLNSQTRIKVSGKDLIIARGSKIVKIDPMQNKEVMTCDTFNDFPIMDVNNKNVFWSENGMLKRNVHGKSGYTESIGTVFQNRTMFWVGEEYGFGIQKASNLVLYFMFDCQSKGINDTIKLPPITGKLLDAKCYFAHGHCWFMTHTKEGSGEFYKAFIIDRKGNLVHQVANQVGDQNGCLKTIRGCCAAGAHLFMPTDDGVLRLDTNWGISTFKGTESVVSVESAIFTSKAGLTIVNPKQIWELTIK